MNDEKIVLIARLKIKSGSVEAAKQAALAIIADSRAENGCLNYDFHQAIDDETIFVWHETWENKAAIDAHGASKHFKDFSTKIKDLVDEPLQITLTRMVSERAQTVG
ncbi:MAG: antibiotic biosynthesis monooxygenase, partial [Acidobacteriota bacterium]|nr:antibiotic biosynthesis monooxygenase [Acidobacteriota bacterium]